VKGEQKGADLDSLVCRMDNQSCHLPHVLFNVIDVIQDDL
jgi:hypothetical protein